MCRHFQVVVPFEERAFGVDPSYDERCSLEQGLMHEIHALLIEVIRIS